MQRPCSADEQTSKPAATMVYSMWQASLFWEQIYPNKATGQTLSPKNEFIACISKKSRELATSLGLAGTEIALCPAGRKVRDG